MKRKAPKRVKKIVRRKSYNSKRIKKFKRGRLKRVKHKRVKKYRIRTFYQYLFRFFCWITEYPESPPFYAWHSLKLLFSRKRRFSRDEVRRIHDYHLGISAGEHELIKYHYRFYRELGLKVPIKPKRKAPKGKRVKKVVRRKSYGRKNVGRKSRR